MRHLRLFSLIAVLSAGLVPGFAGEEVLRYIPVDAVRPGMTGVGYTVFSGTTRERFEFKVRSVVPNFRGWPKVIVGELTGCSGCSEGGVHMFEHHQILHGMSGSPMDVESFDGVPVAGGPLPIGGLAMAKDFATTAKVLITPIEYQLGMAANLKPHTATPTGAERGDYTGACLIYGDRDWCWHTTLTARAGGRLYTTSHDIMLTDTEPLYYGDISLPAFLVPVAELMQSQAGASKLSGERIRPIGTAVLHGKFGFVINEGPLPATVPVRLTVHEVFPEPVRLDLNVAYHRLAPQALIEVIAEVINQLPTDPPASRFEVTIRMGNPAGTIRFADALATGYQSLQNILQRLIGQEREALRIEGIDLSYTPATNGNLWRPMTIHTDGEGPAATLTVLARRTKDNEISQMTETVDLRGVRAYRKRRPVWWDGANLQDVILSLRPVRESLGLLEQITEREALYLVYIESLNDMRPVRRTASQKWTQRLPEIRILASPKFGENRFYIQADADKQVRAVPYARR